VLKKGERRMMIVRDAKSIEIIQQVRQGRCRHCVDTFRVGGDLARGFTRGNAIAHV
jgi:hypothetical protein